MTQNKKPFGLSLASKVAAEAIRQSVAPASVILSNLIVLQKDTLFPKDLDIQYFAIQKKAISDDDKRVVTKMLDALRSPHLSVADLLETFVKDAWVVKKSPAPIHQVQSKAPVKGAVKNKTKPVVKKTTTPSVAPVVIVKKNRSI